MANKNMVNMNTLFRKVYFLAGVMMAANMFIVNEIKAMNQEENESSDSEESIPNKEGRKKIEEDKKFFPHKDTTIYILFRENYFNFFGTLALSGFNNYFKWWIYDAGGYCKFVWFGWRSKRFLNDMFQFDINLNLVRGILWLLPGYLFFFVQGCCAICKRETACSFAISLQFFSPRDDNKEEIKIEKHFRRKIIAFPLFILQGFISAPLTWHISNFSIAISLDSIFWELVTMVAILARERIDHEKKSIVLEKDDLLVL